MEKNIVPYFYKGNKRKHNKCEVVELLLDLHVTSGLFSYRNLDYKSEPRLLCKV